MAEIFEQSKTSQTAGGPDGATQLLCESTICRAQNQEVTDENKSFEMRVKELQVTDEESSQTKVLEDNIILDVFLFVCF